MPTEDGLLRAGVLVTRSGRVESAHRIHVAVADEDGRLVAAAGDPERVTYYRSAAKPFQALPLVEDGVGERFGLTPEELALCCGSHGGEPRHVRAARSILARAGLDEGALACGAHRPLRERAGDELVRRGQEPLRVHNNCSGKHAGMLALAVHHGWPTDGYVDPEHPVQRRMLKEVARWCDVPEREIGAGVDGCGVVTFAVPLVRMAASWARLAGAARRGEPAAELVEAMTDHPFFVAGTDRLCTRLMETAGDRVVAKTGAEGVYCAGLPERALGVALKVEDGARRASEAALVRVLRFLEVLGPGDLGALSAWSPPLVENTRGERVGTIRAEFELERERET